MSNILLLVELMFSLSVSTAAVERGFSAMNLQKNARRSNMQQDTLNDLMIINVGGVNLQDFDPSEAIQNWLHSGPGTRHTEGHALPTFRY